ncbi:hypothetical protein KHS38_05965 [Mucilaginibacter sp. Bleaf8]|uniref:hypothetical protein n=1 Tax=Mucilaginibacter sp. Bleaf8 TaxID=2834430 RepID=UPI001BCBDDE6|nr:hypothetical protein [Mucilaginibacter sp. Bleaf8]MBS7563945.1 hypothetical protein [Mucilaginibacter sp. Bleaf8]
MPKIKLPQFGFNSAKLKLKDSLQQLTQGGLQQIYNKIDQLSVKKGVDELGIDKFITQCALLAAGSGAITGIGGGATMLIGVPLDMINLITQQFRVTMAIAYHQTGKYQLRFDDFFKILASSLKVDAGMTVSKNVMEQVAEKLLLNIGTKTAERLLPIVGAVIGGTTNYLFIKKQAEAALHPNSK